MTESENPQSTIGRRLTLEDTFYLSWAEESLKNTLPFLNDVLRQLVTLSSTLLGGSIAFISINMIGPRYHYVATISFFLALITSFIGILPRRGSVSFQDISQNQHDLEAALNWKLRLCRIAGVLIAFGFLAIIVGLLRR